MRAWGPPQAPVIRVAKLSAMVSASGAYYAAHMLVLAAGFISMPIMTRLLSKAEFGLLGLVYATAGAFALLGGMGLGEAAVRLYGEQEARGSHAARDLVSTLLLTAFVAATILAAGLAAIALAAGAGPEPYIACLPLAGMVVIIRAVSGVVYQIYRVQERAVAHAMTQVAVRYGSLAVTLLLLMVYARDAFTVILATIIVELIILVVRLLDLWRRGFIGIPQRFQPIFGTALAYGLPLALASSARFLLDYADRFMIERMISLDAVANYTVPYDLAAKLTDGLSTPIQLAAVPIIYRLWIAEGRSATSQFASEVLTYMAAIALPIATLYLIYSEHIIVWLASAKYRGVGGLTPYILPGVLLSSFNFIIVAGLTLQKRTLVLASGVCFAAILNVTLNLILIPQWQLVGAAVATTVSYAVLVAGNAYLAASAIDLRIDKNVLLEAVLATVASISVLYVLDLLQPSSALALTVALSVGVLTAGAVFALLDRRLRRLAVAQLTGQS